jgi:hypothetical protein
MRLEMLRQRPQERGRPLIFICHSLGGVVFKKSLVQVTLNEDTHEHLAQSVSGAVFLQLEGSTVLWRAKRHETVVLLTTEAEYTALSQCARELVWTRNLFSELLLPLHMPIPLNGDNQGSLKLCRNPELHQRTKHIPLVEHHI